MCPFALFLYPFLGYPYQQFSTGHPFTKNGICNIPCLDHPDRVMLLLLLTCFLENFPTEMLQRLLITYIVMIKIWDTCMGNDCFFFERRNKFCYDKLITQVLFLLLSLSYSSSLYFASRFTPQLIIYWALRIQHSWNFLFPCNPLDWKCWKWQKALLFLVVWNKLRVGLFF